MNVDEYGKIFCKAHDLETCPICCLSFETINDEINSTPSDRDVGVFLRESDLLDWFDKMKTKMPRVFSPDDTLFGDDAGQHTYGTKLRTFFDEDREHPMECYVLGSKWQEEECRRPGLPTAYADGHEPVYVVLLNGVPAQIHFTSAHEGDQGDWMIDTKRAKKGNGVIINERLDMLARLNSSHHSDQEDVRNEAYEDSKSHTGPLTLEVQNARIQRALKTLYTSEEIDKWGVPGVPDYAKFLQEFLMYCFTPYEYEVILQGGSYTNAFESITIQDRIKAFPPSSVSKSKETNNNFHARIAIAKMAIYHVSEKLGGVIVANKRGTKYQAIEFIGFHESHGVPCISIHYGVDPDGIDRPSDFLAGETTEVMEEDNAVAVCLEEHLLNCTKNKSLNDLGSGLLFYEGFLAPMKLLPISADAKPDIHAHFAIPPVNFGVELEMSCASGIRMEKMASNLSEHAGVEVKTLENQSKGKGGFWPGGPGKGSFDSDDDSVGNSSCSSHSSMPDLDPIPQHHSGVSCAVSSDKSKDKEKPCGKEDKKAARYTKWSICYDKSLKPSEDNPMSTTLELVSPILTGISGLDEMEHTLTVMSDIVCVRLNDSMGLHVHVETKESEYSLGSIISICQQFVIYEEIIDKFLDQSRRSGSKQSHSYFQSNKLSIMSTCKTFSGALQRLSSCKSKKELYDVMNPGFRARYHKLNFQNLKSGRQPTIEFRQHHASKDTAEVKAWVCFCVLFVTNCVKLHPLSSEKVPAEATFDTLFTEVIKCPNLREYYSTKK